MCLGRSQVLWSLSLYLRAHSRGHQTIDRLEEKKGGVDRGNARRSSLKRWERATINQTNIGTVSKATGQISERRSGAHMGFSKRIDTVWNWAELSPPVYITYSRFHSHNKHQDKPNVHEYTLNVCMLCIHRFRDFRKRGSGTFHIKLLTCSCSHPLCVVFSVFSDRFMSIPIPWTQTIWRHQVEVMSVAESSRHETWDWKLAGLNPGLGSKYRSAPSAIIKSEVADWASSPNEAKNRGSLCNRHAQVEDSTAEEKRFPGKIPPPGKVQNKIHRLAKLCKQSTNWRSFANNLPAGKVHYKFHQLEIKLCTHKFH